MAGPLYIELHERNVFDLFRSSYSPLTGTVMNNGYLEPDVQGYSSVGDAIRGIFQREIDLEYERSKDEALLKIDTRNILEPYGHIHGIPYVLTYDEEQKAMNYMRYWLMVMFPTMNKSEKEKEMQEMKEVECKLCDIMSRFNGDRLTLFKWLLENLGEEKIKSLKADDVLTVMIPDNDFYDYTQDVGKPYGRIVNEINESCKVKYVSEADMLRDEIKKIENQMESLKQERDSLLEKLKKLGRCEYKF